MPANKTGTKRSLGDKSSTSSSSSSSSSDSGSSSGSSSSSESSDDSDGGQRQGKNILCMQPDITTTCHVLSQF